MDYYKVVFLINNREVPILVETTSTIKAVDGALEYLRKFNTRANPTLQYCEKLDVGLLELA